MTAIKSLSLLGTHDVTNQPPALENYNLFTSDSTLQKAVGNFGAAWSLRKLEKFGKLLGRRETIDLGFQANRHEPRLKSFNRFGQRIDEIEFHPAYHQLMKIGLDNGVASIAWTAKKQGGHLAHAAMEYMLMQIEGGVCCPVTMTYAAVPALLNEPSLARIWEPKILAASYDPRYLPLDKKSGATIGMAMTEKQGGSDVRANTTSAHKTGKGEYELTGHKWFCSAPMCDAFLTLARTDKGLTCFLVPRWRPDNTRNPFLIQRLKDKLGNRANASGEIEYNGTWAHRVGAEGRGVHTIIEMVHHTRLDTSIAPAGLMRQALVQAIHHASHRTAFQRKLVDQPLMQNVLADLAIESEAATLLAMRIAQAYDQAGSDEGAALFARLGVAIAKYWLNKRAPGFVYEAMECLGGNGYVEESILPRLYREAPLNSIWEGSGNIICLDILRTITKTPAALEVVMSEILSAKGTSPRFDAWLKDFQSELNPAAMTEHRARRLAEKLAIGLQASLTLRFSPAAISDGFCATRLGRDWGHTYGTLPEGLNTRAILRHVWSTAE